MDDDDISISPFDEGTWRWDEVNNRLEFTSNIKDQSFTSPIPVPVTKIAGSLDFSDNPDFLDQLRFQKHYQRTIDNDNDAVTLQDIKDVAIFCAPNALLNIPIINILHLPGTERLLRALIFYYQYYLQVEKTLSDRSSEMKLRSLNTLTLEAELRGDLEDIRFLVAKEYSCMILGGDNFGKYHHMGPKKQLSSPFKDAVLFETLFRYIIQILWIALGRPPRKDVEIEVSRLFKSDKFNFAEHKYKLQAASKTKPLIMLGHCIRRDRMLKTESPLNNEMFCKREISYIMSGIGVINYSKLTPRLKYFERVLILPEEQFKSLGITVGILGRSRKLFDPMLKEIKQQRSESRRFTPLFCRQSSRISMRTMFAPMTLLADIQLPKQEIVDGFEEEFPSDTCISKPINIAQKSKWIEKVRLRSQRKRKLKENLMAS